MVRTCSYSARLRCTSGSQHRFAQWNLDLFAPHHEGGHRGKEPHSPLHWNERTASRSIGLFGEVNLDTYRIGLWAGLKSLSRSVSGEKSCNDSAQTLNETSWLWKSNFYQQDKQCTYNTPLWRIRVIIFAMERQQCFLCVVLSYM